MSILLAEGNPTHRRFARQLLAQHFPDYGPVREVADGAAAVQMALTGRPGLVVVDVDLPRVHGVEAARRTRHRRLRRAGAAATARQPRLVAGETLRRLRVNTRRARARGEGQQTRAGA